MKPFSASASHPISSLVVLKDKFVDDSILALQLDFKHLNACAQVCVVYCEIVSRHLLFDDIVVETLSFLVDNPRPQLSQTLL